MTTDQSDVIGAGMSQHAILQMLSGAKGFYFGTTGPVQMFGGQGPAILITDPKAELPPDSHVQIIGKKDSGHGYHYKLPGKEDLEK
jgi:hypothetical protein